MTYDITVASACTLVRQEPRLDVHLRVGAGADGTGKSRTTWARVKGETENAILAMPFKGKYVLRPAFMRPMHRITSHTRSDRALHAICGPIAPLLTCGLSSTSREMPRKHDRSVP